MIGKKKCTIALVVMVALASFGAMPLQGDSTQYITVVLSVNADAEISVNKSIWTANNAGVGECAQTTTDWGLLDNTGVVDVDVAINITKKEGTVWDVSEDGEAGHNKPAFRFYRDSWQILNETQQTFYAALSHQSSTTFGLNVTMPSSTSTNQDQNFTITFVATPCGG
jgi:hypothetical protein